MIQRQLKLRLTKAQERELERWLYHLTSVWNWAVRKIELDGNDGIYYSKREFNNLLSGHSAKLGIPSHVLQGVLTTAYQSWQRCFKKQCKKPRLKGRRNKLNSIPFPDPFRPAKANRLHLLGIGSVRFYLQAIPGKIKSARLVRRATGWYLCAFVDAESNVIPALGRGEIGIDPGFSSLLTLSTGEKIAHPRERRQLVQRLSQAQRGGNQNLATRISEHIANQRKDRNHKLSRRIVSENQFIAFSADPHRNIAKRFGKSVHDSAHYQLRQMFSYKSKRRTDGLGVYVEPDCRNSTRTCSACGALTGPQGWAGLSVREWDCGACGAHHDRDTNAAMNALISGGWIGPRDVREGSLKSQSGTGESSKTVMSEFIGGQQ